MSERERTIRKILKFLAMVETWRPSCVRHGGRSDQPGVAVRVEVVAVAVVQAGRGTGGAFTVQSGSTNSLSIALATSRKSKEFHLSPHQVGACANVCVRMPMGVWWWCGVRVHRSSKYSEGPIPTIFNIISSEKNTRKTTPARV